MVKTYKQKVRMRFPIFSAIFGLMIVIGLIGIGYMHEQVHVQIYKGYGVEAHVEYLSDFPNFATVSTGCPVDKPECRLAHNINEAISYPLQVVYIIICFGLFFLIALGEIIEVRLREYNDRRT